MSNAISCPTACDYLFNKGAESIFPSQNSLFVNQSLQTMMEVIDHLVTTSPEAMFIFDPTAYNNQCHLYTLFFVQIINQAQKGDGLSSANEMTKKGVDRRFLYLSFFLSYAFLTNPKLLDKLISKTLAAMKATPPSREFSLFCKASEPLSLRTQAAREALNKLFEEHMKKRFLSGEDPLYPELAKMAEGDLQMNLSNGSSKGTFYTLPKFAGVAYLVDVISKEKIPLLFKVKVVTKEGNGFFSYSSQQIEKLGSTTPVIVFEMIATDDSLSFLECRDIAKRCPINSRRNVSRKERHKETESCRFCASERANVEEYQKKFQPILEKSDEMLLALAADFMLQSQSSFLPYFSDRKKFPQLTTLFDESLPNIENFSVSMDKPLNMSVSRVYADPASLAAEDTLIINASYETHLKARKLI